MRRPALSHKIRFQRTVEGMELEAHNFGFTLETHASWMLTTCRTLPHCRSSWSDQLRSI